MEKRIWVLQFNTLNIKKKKQSSSCRSAADQAKRGKGKQGRI